MAWVLLGWGVWTLLLTALYLDARERRDFRPGAHPWERIDRDGAVWVLSAPAIGDGVRWVRK